MRIALCTFGADISRVPEFNTIHDLIAPQRREYCDRHNYQHWHHYGIDYTGGYYAIQRLEYVLHRFEDNDADLVWILNLAAVITNLDIPIAQYIYQDGICICRDRNGLNAGSMVLHCSQRTIEYLHEVIRLARLTSHPWYEQHIIQCLEVDRRWSDLYHILPSPSINQYKHSIYGWPEGEAQDWKPGDFVVHFPGRALDERIRLVRWALEQSRSNGLSMVSDGPIRGRPISDPENSSLGSTS
jgi:hypothetical protein